jgi:membrane protein implicated in regulation of membrane protease activity
MKRVRASRTALLRYWAFQMPGFALAAALSFAAWEWFDMPAWAALCALGLWVAKDAVLGLFVAHAYEGHAHGGPHDLVGKRGVAVTDVAPSGAVRVRGERWRAQCAPGTERIAAGDAVRVVELEGLTAIVEAVSSPRVG